MRIQHNIMAMNAYRNYTSNVNAMKSNLEKLSSGYKINRAGDDAAGLAISEKMRAQITGLSAAQKNVKDGISLVQTAEGAMQEVQDMLNRMVYLATQSANGTYDDEVDRDNLQKELEQLRGEIDRISDSANFNGIKLLDGSQEAAAGSPATWSDPVELGTIAAAGATHGTDSVLHTDGVTRQEPSFTVDLTNVEFTSKGTNGFKINVGGTDIVVATKNGTDAVADKDVVKGEDLAKAIVAAVNANATTVKGVKEDGTDSEVLNGIAIDGLVYQAKVEGNNVKFELATKDKDGTAIKAQEPAGKDVSIPQNPVTISVAAAGDGTLTGLDAAGHANTKITPYIAAKDGEMACAKITLAANTIKDGTKITIGDKTYTFAIGKDSTVKAGKGETLIDMTDVKADDAKLQDKAIAKLTQQDNGWFRLESNASNTLTAVETKNYAGKGDLKTFDGLKSNFKISQMTAATPAPAGGNKGLTFQIGDTAETFNQLNVSIGDIHCKALGIDKISIADQTSAQNAIQSIKDAINTVSGIRGDLGATQNRLEHTANNLSVMQENITDAESSIRDTDVAEEMMAYTKNNILIQAAQAMLAQANQIPQGVLQLLQ